MPHCSMPLIVASKVSPMRSFKRYVAQTLIAMRSVFWFLISFAEIQSQTSITLFLRSYFSVFAVLASSL